MYLHSTGSLSMIGMSTRTRQLKSASTGTKNRLCRDMSRRWRYASRHRRIMAAYQNQYQYQNQYREERLWRPAMFNPRNLTGQRLNAACATRLAFTTCASRATCTGA
jgi:hypothetical protein